MSGCDKIKTCTDVCNCLVLESPDGSILIEKNEPCGGCKEGNCKYKLKVRLPDIPDVTETITHLSYNEITRVVTYENEDHEIESFVIPNDIQTISLNGGILTLSQGGGSVNIAQLIDSMQIPFVMTSNSLVVTPGGTKGHSPKIEVVPSTDQHNIFSLGSDGKPYVPGYLPPPYDICTRMTELFPVGDDQEQYNGVNRDTYNFMALDRSTSPGTCQALVLSAPTDFAVVGTGHQSAFGGMQWFTTAANANSSASTVAGNTLLLYKDVATALSYKNGVNYSGVGKPTLVSISATTYKGAISNFVIRPTSIQTIQGASDIVFTNVDIYSSSDVIITEGANVKGGRFFITSPAKLIISGVARVSDIYVEGHVEISGGAKLENAKIIDKDATPSVAALFVKSGTPSLYPQVNNVDVSSVVNRAISTIYSVSLTNSRGFSSSEAGIYVHGGSDDLPNVINASFNQGRSISGPGFVSVSAQVIVSPPTSYGPVTKTSLINWNISHNTGISDSDSGLYLLAGNARMCTGISQTGYGIRIGGSDQPSANVKLIECVGDSLTKSGLSIKLDCFVYGGTFISRYNNAAGNPITIADNAALRNDYYHLVGVKTVATHPSAYAIKYDGVVPMNKLTIAGCIFTNPNVNTTVLGIDPALTPMLRSVTHDSYGNIF